MTRLHSPILLLDDEQFALNILTHMLAALGYTNVTAYDSGADALLWLESASPPIELILMDLNMPGMDGVEFVRKLVDRGYGGDLILVSGEDERTLQMVEKLIKAHHIPVTGHLNKPASREALSALLEKSSLEKNVSSARSKTYTAEALRAAIKNGELVNFYQPKINVHTGALVGVETLVRWQHPQDGLVYPDQFIALAEQSNLIDDLTAAVMFGAMVQAKHWQRDGLQLRVAINISMENLNALSFADFVADAAAAAGVKAQDIILELTESKLMLDQRAPLEALARLRLKRFHLSIDDFGTGHSSLSQLNNIPFDELKIDQSFVTGACQDETARAIYIASLSLGKQLGMKVIAEGVETREEWDFLRSTQCDMAQGYFIARPMPAADLINWIVMWEDRIAGLMETAS